MKPITTLATIAATTALSACLVTTAQAAVVWSMPATACEITMGQDNAEKTAGLVTFKAGRTGFIRLVCPIVDMRGASDPAMVPAFVGMTYRDQDGTGSNAAVTLSVLKTRIQGGFVLETSRLSSNSLSSPFLTFGSARFGPTLAPTNRRFDFEGFYHSVQVILQRSDANTEASFAGAVMMTSP